MVPTSRDLRPPPQIPRPPIPHRGRIGARKTYLPSFEHRPVLLYSRSGDISILVVGSVAYDSIVTPAGSRKEALGGSATYFAVSSSYFTPVSVVAVVGDDFRTEDVDLLKSRMVDTSGLETREGKTFRWSGVYGTEDVNTRETLDTQPNVFVDFSPTLSTDQRAAPYLFLANTDPDLQLDVLSQMENRPELVALDTMNYWIAGKNSSLRGVLAKVDTLFIDEGEARDLASEVNLTRCAKHIMGLGPKTVVIKRGEHGVILFAGESVFAAPALPLENVVDATGAGDSFAGGFLGYLAATRDRSMGGLRQAAVLGSVMGSFAVESFSLDRVSSLSHIDIQSRYQAFARLTQFTPLQEGELLPWRNHQ